MVPTVNPNSGGLRSTQVVSLPMARQQPPERVDAARNRQRVLDAAALVVHEQGVSRLQMDDVARIAGVGVGTIYRRFGDKAGLLVALLDCDEQAFQERFLFGPPPLGPGASAGKRIEAFLRALVVRSAERGEILLVAETASTHARYSKAYALHHTHLAALLAEAAPHVDAAWVADALLAPIAASLVTYQIQERGMTTERIGDGLIALLEAIAQTTDVPL